jgi:hypothetical protein
MALPALESISMLRLRRNLGHQRAIAVGLAFIAAHGSPDVVVLMDGDGEDDPEAIPQLLEQLRERGGDVVVFAERTIRSESMMFCFFYRVYQVLHWILTGIPVRVGNFSAIPRRCLAQLVTVAELWNHYAAAVFRTRIPRSSIPSRRAKRLAGRSHMRFVPLVSHGLSALSVHSEVVGVRLLVAVAILCLLLLIALPSVLLGHLAGWITLPLWTPFVAGLVLVAAFQCITLAFGFVFVVLNGRSSLAFMPCRDYAYFVEGVTDVVSARKEAVEKPPGLGAVSG